MWEALKNPVIYTTGATALVALAGLLYNVWQDNRRLRIEFRPTQWSYSRTVDNKSTLVFYVRVNMFNPGRTPNRITRVRTWRDGVEIDNLYGMFGSVDVAPFEATHIDIRMTAIENTPDDPQRALETITLLELEVRALRGRKRMVLEPQAFRHG